MIEKTLSLFIAVLLLLGLGIWVPFLEFASELITSIRMRKLLLQRYDVSANSSASPRTVYSLLVNGASWPSWTQIDSFQLEQTSSYNPPEPRATAQGVGAIRVFRTGLYRSREKILGLVLNRQMTYTILPGSMLRDYHATIDLTPTHDGGTDVHWSGSFRTSIPGFTWLMQLYLNRLMQSIVEGLARHAEGSMKIARAS